MLPLSFVKHHSTKTYWGVEAYLHAFLTSALVGGKWLASCLGRFTYEETSADIHWLGGWGVLETV